MAEGGNGGIGGGLCGWSGHGNVMFGNWERGMAYMIIETVYTQR